MKLFLAAIIIMSIAACGYIHRHPRLDNCSNPFYVIQNRDLCPNGVESK